jgi:transcriptional regulator with XRE-family HTH domain
MFEMKSIGRKIAMLRKEKNLTQMELADMLNISYQAVSNWERGETMPDISKLPELAQIFNHSIDEILGNQQSTKIIENIIEDNLIEDEISMEDFKSVAPLLKPTQISEISKEINITDNINDMVDYLPFVSREVAEKLVLKAIELNYEFNGVANALPFVGREVADAIAQNGIDSNQILLDVFLPFVSRECAEKLVLKAIELNYEFKSLTNAIPFVSKEVADKIVGTKF